MKKLIIGLTVFFIASSFIGLNDNQKLEMQDHNFGILGQKAPELEEFKWIGNEGEDIPSIQLEDYKGKFIVLYCFQSWCPGCHSRGLPSLEEMSEALKDNDKVEFLAIQTVFEGGSINTFDKLRETQLKYDLEIPFGHDPGGPATRDRSSTMYNYRTGGTPWFIFIDQTGKVVFNDYHLDTEKAIDYLKSVTK